MCRQADALRELAHASGELSAACLARLENLSGPLKRRNRGRTFRETMNDTADAAAPREWDEYLRRLG